MSKVSIITPVYNSANFISITIQSVINQTYTNWEMLLVNDCSTDNSLEIIQAFADKDERIVVINNDQNLGQVKSRNRAIDQASGRYIAMLDSDDVWHPEKLEKQIQFFKEQNCVIQHSYYEHIDESGQPLQKRVEAPHKINYFKLLESNFMGCLTVIYDTQEVGKAFMPEVGKRDDWACWLSILKKGHEAYCIPEVLAYYRIRSKSLSSNKLKMLKYNWNILTKHQGIPAYRAAWYMLTHVVNSVKKHFL